MSIKDPDSASAEVDVSILIVTWNSADVINGCVQSVINNSKYLNAELIIVDNNSDDETFSLINKINFLNLQTYQNAENLGYTKAVNQAIKFSRGRNIFLLNPDTVLNDECIETLCSFLDKNEEYGACAPLMLNEDGTVQHSVRDFPSYLIMFFEFSLLAYIFPKSKLFGRWKMKYYTYNKDDDINQPMAAALMIKRKSLDSMDNHFEMFFNDVDICKRIIDNGKKIRFIKSAIVTHKHGESINKDKIRMIKTWNRDCIQYFKKYHPNPFLLLWLGINLKISEIIRIFIYKYLTPGPSPNREGK
ncbi:MAG TPA: glycosyltransferase [Ignavibacteria bacterium]|jgi:hypothetical protein